MAHISSVNASLKIEPIKQLGFSFDASPFSFLVDGFTVGYVAPCGIVLHCLPLRQERMIILKPEIRRVVKVVSSHDGEFLAVLEVTTEDFTQIQVFHISTVKLLQTIPLARKIELPDELYFAQQTKTLLLLYRTNARAIVLSWQRGAADECLNVMDDPKLIQICPYSQSTITTANQANQLRFWRLFDSELRPFAPTRMKQLVQGQSYVKLLYLSGGLVGCVLQSGEILVFQPPKFIGAIQIPKNYSDEDKQDFDVKQQLRLRGPVTLAETRGDQVVLVTKTNQLMLIEINTDIQGYLQRFKAQNLTKIVEDQKTQRDYFANEFSDDLDTLDELMDLLPKGDLDAFKVPVSLYPYRIITSAQLHFDAKITAVHINMNFCLVEAGRQLFVWNFASQTVFYNGVTLVGESEMQDFDRKTTNEMKVTEDMSSRRQLTQKIISDQQDSVIKTLMNTQFQELSIDVSTVRTIINYVNLYKLIDEHKQFLDFNELDDYFWEGDNITSDAEDKALQLDILGLKENALNQLTPPITFNIMIQGLGFKNLTPQPLVAFSCGPRATLNEQYCVPTAFRVGEPIIIKNITQVCVAQKILLIKADDTIYGLKIPSLEIFAKKDFLNARQIEISPDERVFYILVFDSVAIVSILENQFKTICQTNFKGVTGIKMSHSGGFIALIIEYNNKFLAQIYSTANFKLVLEVSAHSTRIVGLNFGIGDYCVFTNSEDGIIYGHSLTGERIFEQATRGITLNHTMALLQNQVQESQEEGEMQENKRKFADTLNKTVVQSEQKQNEYESYVVVGFDKENTYYEVNGFGQSHEVKIDAGCTVHCVLPVPSLITKWNGKQIKLFGALNTEDEISAIERESQTATAAIFSKALGDFFDKQQISRSVNTTDQGLIVVNKNVYDERRLFFDYDSRQSHSRHGDQLGEVSYRFALMAVNEGFVVCYDWPIRENTVQFKIKLHQDVIFAMYIIHQSYLVTVSKSQVMVSNLRFLLPQEGIFGLNIRNKDLAKMKRTIGKQTMQLKIPITRLYNHLNNDLMLRSIETTSQLDNLLIQMINNMKDMWTFTDFRMNLFKENVRDKKSQIQKGINMINQNKTAEIQLIKDRLKVVQDDTEVLVKQETNRHTNISQQVQGQYESDIQDLRQMNDKIQKDIIKFQQSQRTIMREAEKLREEILLQTKQSIQIHEIEKQNHLDHLDEVIDSIEKQMNEELKQIQEEREIISKQLQQNTDKTKTREQNSIAMLKTWASIQDRKLIQIKLQMQELQNQMIQGYNLQQSMDTESTEVSRQIETDVKILKDKDNDIKNREKIVFRLKEEITELSKYQSVLNQQVNRIKLQIGPRDTLITDIKSRSEDLGRKLEDTTKTWDQIKIMTENEQQAVLDCTEKVKKLYLQERGTDAYYRCARDEFSNFMIEKPMHLWFPEVLKFYLKHFEVLKLMDSKQSHKKVDVGNFADVMQEIEGQKAILNSKLTFLYAGLSNEDQKFANVQQFSLDENSALLEESHRLKVENLDLVDKLQKINSMIQALKVQEVTDTLQKTTRTVNRTESLMKSMNQRFGKSEPRSLSVLSNTLKAERDQVRGLLGVLQQVPQHLKQVQDIDDDEV